MCLKTIQQTPTGDMNKSKSVNMDSELGNLRVY